MLPKQNLRIDAQWSVCDTLNLDEFRENQAAENQIKTSVIAGVSRRQRRPRRRARCW